MQHNQPQINVNNPCFKHKFDMKIKVRPMGDDPTPIQLMMDLVDALKDSLKNRKGRGE